MKNLLFKVDGQVVAIGVPGDREVDEKRLEAALAPARVAIFEAADFYEHPELVRGYVGPQGLARLSVAYFADPRVAPGTAWVTGANRTDAHARNVVAGRDFNVDRYIDVASVRSGDPCPACDKVLQVGRAIEVGHIFQLGRKYTDALDVDVAGPDGMPVRLTMGSYGIGVSRAVAAIVEQHHDSSGLCWPKEIAPYDVHMVPVGKGEEHLAVAGQLAEELDRNGHRVLIDDRGLAAGVAFADADLLGMPTIVIVGRALTEGRVEIKDRRSGARTTVAIEDLVGHVGRPREPSARGPASTAG